VAAIHCGPLLALGIIGGLRARHGHICEREQPAADGAEHTFVRMVSPKSVERMDVE
jgi:hypothetical protein